MWYQDPAWCALIVSVLTLIASVVALIVTANLMWRTFRMAHESHPTYSCDSQFLEIEKVFLSDPRLFPFYRLGPEFTVFWDQLSEDEKRLYILTEMHYFHLAFAHREYKAGRVKPDYWKIYENWLRTLVQFSPMFLEVHRHEKNNFEEEFDDLVSEIEIRYHAPRR